MELLQTIEIPLYIQHVKLSNKRRATHYKKSSKKKVPKKYEHLKFSKKGILIHKDGTPVIANPKAVGTPKLKKINGQEIYSGMPHHMRSKIVKAIKDSFKLILKKHTPVSKLPIQVEWELHDVVGNANWDLDNLWIYNKCFQDALADQKIIPDDNICYITKSAAPEFVPIEDDTQRKFIFKIYHDNREVIKSHPYYKDMDISKEKW